MFKPVRLSVALLLVAAAVFGLQTASAATPKPIPGEVLVSFKVGQDVTVTPVAGKPHTGIASLDAVLSRDDVATLEPLFGGMVQSFKDPAVRADLARHFIIRHGATGGNAAVIRDLEALSMVDVAESNLLLPADGTAYNPDDLVDTQWYIRNTDLGGSDTRALGGWAESLGDSNVIVAVLDSGVDYRHPDLGGTGPDYARGSIWMNWTEYYGTPGVDDDSNGLVDDIRGWDFINLAPSQVYPGEDPGPPDNDPMDFGGHGTLVSGCIAPITDNGIGIAAMAPGCKIMAVRIGWLSSDGNGYSNAGFMAQGFTYAAANGAKIINLSYGTGYSSAFDSAINAALSAGCIICVSAGNDATDVPGYLQGLNDDRILTVAATNSNDGKADFSDYGSWIDVCAPGVAIWTTAYVPSSDTHTYTSTQGTSFSSPITAGACALIWSAHPEFTSSQVVTLLQNTCDNIDSENPGFIGDLGHGRINLLMALGDNVQQVPGEFALLRDAMVEAAPGDTIKVLSNQILTETTMLGKGLKIFGAYDPGYVTRDPLNNPTVVQGGNGHPALNFLGDVDNTAEIDGFLCQGGEGRYFSDLPYTGYFGGGIMLNQKSPVLRNLRITANSVGSSADLGMGGGIALYNSTAVLENVQIDGNSAVYGSGIFVYKGSPTFTNVTVSDNTPNTSNAANPPEGGGICLVDATVHMTDITVSGHLGTNRGGGILAKTMNTTTNILTIDGGTISGNSAKTNGAGICQLAGTLTLNNVDLEGNTRTADATFMGGGGLFASDATVTIDGGGAYDNTANVGAGIQLTNCASAQIGGAVFSGNAALYWAGGIALDGGTTATLTSSTFTGNDATASGGGGIYLSGGSLDLSNTITAFNTGGTSYGNGIGVLGGATTVSCCDLYGNASNDVSGIADPVGSNGNIAADPLFCDAPNSNFHVANDSPCAPANSGGCDLIGALSAGCGATPVEDMTPAVFHVSPNFPNPFNPSTTIRFDLPAAARTRVMIYDVAGRLVRTLLDEDLPAATHSLQWNGTDNAGRTAAAGVYFYRVRSGQNDFVGRMALVK